MDENDKQRLSRLSSSPNQGHQFEKRHVDAPRQVVTWAVDEACITGPLTEGGVTRPQPDLGLVELCQPHQDGVGPLLRVCTEGEIRGESESLACRLVWDGQRANILAGEVGGWPVC